MLSVSIVITQNRLTGISLRYRLCGSFGDDYVRSAYRVSSFGKHGTHTPILHAKKELIYRVMAHPVHRQPTHIIVQWVIAFA